jgi:hypothetical protein
MSREQILQELERAALRASEALDAARQELTHIDDPTARRVQALKIQSLAVERDRCNAALFATPITR